MSDTTKIMTMVNKYGIFMARETADAIKGKGVEYSRSSEMFSKIMDAVNKLERGE
ncbi:MAG: hypothetical protein GY800_09145 [Planctomycetes bacterium]|nr:hypothetical protein [Planctomycetota bacterium]